MIIINENIADIEEDVKEGSKEDEENNKGRGIKNIKSRKRQQQHRRCAVGGLGRSGMGWGKEAINKQTNNKQEGATQKKSTASGIQMRQALKYNTPSIHQSAKPKRQSINQSIYLSIYLCSCHLCNNK